MAMYVHVCKKGTGIVYCFFLLPFKYFLLYKKQNKNTALSLSTTELFTVGQESLIHITPTKLYCLFVMHLGKIITYQCVVNETKVV